MNERKSTRSKHDMPTCVEHISRIRKRTCKRTHTHTHTPRIGQVHQPCIGVQAHSISTCTSQTSAKEKFAFQIQVFKSDEHTI